MKKFMAKLRGGKKVVVVALGDSITELTWHTRGRLTWVGLLQEALHHFSEALGSQPGYASAHINAGLAMQALGDRAAARRHFAEAARLEPGNPKAHALLEQAR